MYVPGCPPRPEQLLASIIEMQDKIMRTGTVYGSEFAKRTKSDGPPPFDRDEVRRLQEAAPVPGLEIYTPEPHPKANL
jgi:NADH-quinone oxidoreductase subunit B